jgi:hypothetical protein
VEFRADINIRDCVWPTRPLASKREVVMLFGLLLICN